MEKYTLNRKEKMKDYYQKEIEAVLKAHDFEYPLRFQVSGTSGKTKNLSLNKESLGILISLLQQKGKLK